MFLVWFDPDKRRTTFHKMEDAVAVYREKFDTEPVLCLVNESEASDLAGNTGSLALPIQSAPYVARNTFYVGDFEQAALVEEPPMPVVAPVPAPELSSKSAAPKTKASPRSSQSSPRPRSKRRASPPAS